MVRLIFDDQTNGVSTEVDLSFEDLPRSWVASMAEDGDTEAQAWLDAHPPEGAR